MRAQSIYMLYYFDLCPAEHVTVVLSRIMRVVKMGTYAIPSNLDGIKALFVQGTKGEI